MATCCSPHGVTIIEVNDDGAIVNTWRGFGKNWPRNRDPGCNPHDPECASPEWLYWIVTAPDPGTLGVLERRKEAELGRPASCGTSVTSKGTMIHVFNDEGGDKDDGPFFALAQGILVDPDGNPVPKPGPDVIYRASAFILSRNFKPFKDPKTFLGRAWRAGTVIGLAIFAARKTKS